MILEVLGGRLHTTQHAFALQSGNCEYSTVTAYSTGTRNRAGTVLCTLCVPPLDAAAFGNGKQMEHAAFHIATQKARISLY